VEKKKIEKQCLSVKLPCLERALDLENGYVQTTFDEEESVRVIPAIG